jgi:hypothetical protein
MRTATEGGEGVYWIKKRGGDLYRPKEREVEMCRVKKKCGFLPFTGARKGC